VGLAIVVWLILSAALRVWRALKRTPRDPRMLGLVAGVTGYLGTCLTGHPLLIDETSLPFWLCLGLLFSLAGSVLRDDARTESAAKGDLMVSPGVRLGAAGVAAALTVLSAAGAVRGAVEPPAREAVDGLYPWEPGLQGRYRWSEQYSSLFVAADATRAT